MLAAYLCTNNHCGLSKICNHRQQDGLFGSLFRPTRKHSSKFCIYDPFHVRNIGVCRVSRMKVSNVQNVTLSWYHHVLLVVCEGGFPLQRASNMEFWCLPHESLYAEWRIYQLNTLSLLQIMVCHLFGTKPLPRPTLIVHLGTSSSEIWIKLHKYQWTEMHLKCHLQNIRHIFLGSMSYRAVE